MVLQGTRRFRMKSNAVVGGIDWWREGGTYRGQDGTGAVRTVHLWSPDGGDSLEVLRCSVFEEMD